MVTRSNPVQIGVAVTSVIGVLFVLAVVMNILFGHATTPVDRSTDVIPTIDGQHHDVADVLKLLRDRIETANAGDAPTKSRHEAASDPSSRVKNGPAAVSSAAERQSATSERSATRTTLEGTFETDLGDVFAIAEDNLGQLRMTLVRSPNMWDASADFKRDIGGVNGTYAGQIHAIFSSDQTRQMRTRRFLCMSSTRTRSSAIRTTSSGTATAEKVLENRFG